VNGSEASCTTYGTVGLWKKVVLSTETTFFSGVEYEFRGTWWDHSRIKESLPMHRLEDSEQLMELNKGFPWWEKAKIKGRVLLGQQVDRKL
jgi:hypothetical protein